MNSSNGITRTLAAYAATTASEQIPSEITRRAKHLMVDLVGSIIRAGREVDSTPAIFGMLRALGLDAAGQASVFGERRGYIPAAAALLNGALGHSLDFDDTHADSSLHPSAPVVPAALAAAEMVGASGANFLAAVAIGYEVCCRLGNALDPSSHYARGFHPTATAGVFGAAAAAGRLLGLETDAMVSAFGIAQSQAAGSLQFLVNGAWNKRYQVGAAAMNGLIAASLAREGFVGAAEAVEGKHGLLAGYTDQPHPEKAVADLGIVYETLNIGVKPYPSCRYTHAALDGLLALRQAGSWSDPADVIKVTVGLHRNGITLTGAPLQDKRRPKTIVDGQFSMPFTAAVALLYGRFGWDDYALLSDLRVETMADRVFVERDERQEAAKHPFGASLKIETRNGIFDRLIPDPSGEPSSFPDEGQISEKFLLLSTPVLGEEAQKLLTMLMHIEGIRDVSLMSLKNNI